MKITFMLEEKNNLLTNAFLVEDSTAWTDLIIKFADFLNAQYGYNVKEQIVFVSDFNFNGKFSVIGERTISKDALLAAKKFDEENDDNQEELDFDK